MSTAKRKFFPALLLFILIQVMISGAFTINASAASKPAAVKKKVTLYTDSPKYKIELKNVAGDATLKYSSADKSVVTVKKGKVTPVAPGKAVVTVKVKQNGKTYKVKITFTVKEKASGEDTKDPAQGKQDSVKKDDPDSDYVVSVVEKSNLNSLFNDERAINAALASGSTDSLSKDEKKLYDTVIKTAAQLKGSNDYETVKNIHDYLVLNFVYTLPSNGRDMGVHSLDQALNSGKVVCDGYAKAFYFLTNACGIETILLGGEATNDSGTESHAWNKVKINNKWYAIDVTWDDPYPDETGTVRYEYFLVTDSDIAYDHTWDDKGLPDAVSDDLGIIYEMYRDYPKYKTAQEAYDEVSAQCIEFLEKRERGSSLELSFLVLSGNNDFVKKAIEFIGTCYYKYGCGYSYSYESAGFYGMGFTIKVFY